MKKIIEKMEWLLEQGCTIVYIAVEGQLCGYLALADTVREESKGMIAALKKQRVEPVLLTGDHENAAKAISREIGIDKVEANCLPENKLTAIEAFQKEAKKVCMIGDGINDAPALKKADVGTATPDSLIQTDDENHYHQFKLFHEPELPGNYPCHYRYPESGCGGFGT